MAGFSKELALFRKSCRRNYVQNDRTGGLRDGKSSAAVVGAYTARGTADDPRVAFRVVRSDIRKPPTLIRFNEHMEGER